MSPPSLLILIIVGQIKYIYLINWAANLLLGCVCMPVHHTIDYRLQERGDASGTSPLQVTLEHTLHFKLHCNAQGINTHQTTNPLITRPKSVHGNELPVVGKGILPTLIIYVVYLTQQQQKPFLTSLVMTRYQIEI